MAYELTGKLKTVLETQSFSSGFTKREFVVTSNAQYPQDIKLEFTKDKCALLDRYKVGQEVTVSFNILGNEYNGKYFVNLQAWKIESAGATIRKPLDPLAAVPSDDEFEQLPF
jgi:single-strand DNA-binding protein